METQSSVERSGLRKKVVKAATFGGVVILAAVASIKGYNAYKNFANPYKSEWTAEAKKLGYPTEVNYQLNPAHWRAKGMTTDAEISQAILTSIVDSENACFNIGCTRTNPDVISDNYTGAGRRFKNHFMRGHKGTYHAAVPRTSSDGQANFHSSNVTCAGDVAGIMHSGVFVGSSIERSYADNVQSATTEAVSQGNTMLRTSSQVFQIGYVVINSSEGMKIWAGGSNSGYLHAQDAASSCVTVKSVPR